MSAADFRLRTRIGAELVGIHNELRQSQLADPLTSSIRNWHRDFSAEFRASNREQEILNVYLERMRNLLHSPVAETPLDPTRILFNAPLDEGSVLGTDGNTYGEKALKLYLHAIQQQNRTRFPYQPNNAADFIVTPHPLAQHMIGWLDRHEQRDRNPEQEALYNTLRNELPPLPTVRLVRANRYAERMAQRLREAEEAELAPLEQGLAQFREENVAAARAQLAPLQQQMDQNEAARSARVGAVREEHVQFQQQHNAQIDALENRLHNVNLQNNSRDQEIHNSEVAVENLAKSQADLQRAIDAARQPPPKKKHHWEKVAAGIAIAAVGGIYIPF